MVEDDQESYFDDSDEQEPIKVSVKFKPLDRENHVECERNSDDKIHDDTSTSEDPRQANDTSCDSGTEESRLPIDPPVTPILPCVDPEECLNAEQPEVLEGWKGYSNNIYIQPIVVNPASCDTYSTNHKTQQRLTSQDLRKQMHLREANSWVTKHNERIKSTGTLRTRIPFNSIQDLQETKEFSKQAKYNGKEMKKQGKARGPLHKGFVCRTWVSKFLQDDTAKDDEEKYIPIFVQKCMDNSKSSSTVAKNVITKISEEKKETLQITQTKPDLRELTESKLDTNVCKLEITLNQKAYVDENNNTTKEKCIKGTPGNFQSLQNISGRLFCRCGERLTHDMEIKGRHTQSTSPTTKRHGLARSSSSEESPWASVPMKQFPPINPLDSIKKPNSQARTKSGVLPVRRPHRVDTAMLLREAIVVNGHCYLWNNKKTREVPSRKPSEERGLILPTEYYNRDRKMHPGIKFDRNWSEGLYLLGSRSEAGTTAKETLFKSATPQSSLHESKRSQERRRRCRSLSVPLGNNKQSLISLKENQNVLYGNSVKRLPFRTKPHSLNDVDNDSGTDSNDTGLGSEIEYAFDGSAKLDIYLQPRGASFR